MGSQELPICFSADLLEHIVLLEKKFCRYYSDLPKSDCLLKKIALSIRIQKIIWSKISDKN
jgi:hypothetical protein